MPSKKSSASVSSRRSALSGSSSERRSFGRFRSSRPFIYCRIELCLEPLQLGTRLESPFFPMLGPIESGVGQDRSQGSDFFLQLGHPSLGVERSLLGMAPIVAMLALSRLSSLRLLLLVNTA